jgi:RecJ-like exonuclease
MPATKRKCPACKGTGKQHCKSTFHNFDGKGNTKRTEYEIECLWCHGKGEMNDEEQKTYQACQDVWCTCGNPSGEVVPYRYPDGCHGYDCADCGKLLQTG